jgi:amino acid permease
MEGLSNFHKDQAFVGGISAFATNIAVTLYSCGGVELVAVAAGESSKPYKSVPRATRATFFRIVIFYILTILTIGLCINQNDPTLLNANSKHLLLLFIIKRIKRRRLGNTDATASPVTTVFLRAGFGLATHVVNAVLLTAVLSVTNSCYYASSRMLLAMAKSGQAPRIFGVVNKRGVPVPALL